MNALFNPAQNLQRKQSRLLPASDCRTRQSKCKGPPDIESHLLEGLSVRKPPCVLSGLRALALRRGRRHEAEDQDTRNTDFGHYGAEFARAYSSAIQGAGYEHCQSRP
jgi:hypothetical protein